MLELGKFYDGPDAAELTARSASPPRRRDDRSEVADGARPLVRRRACGVDEARVDELRRHAEGFSWQTYTLAVEARRRRGAGYGGARRAARRPARAVRHRRPVHAAPGGARALRRPDADLHWLELDPSVLGMPFYVMERVEGVVPVQWRGNDPAIFPNDEARREIGLEFVDVLTRIHAIDRRRAGLAFLGAPRLRRRRRAARDRALGARTTPTRCSSSCPLVTLRARLAARERRDVGTRRPVPRRLPDRELHARRRPPDRRRLRLGAGAHLRPGRGHRLRRPAAVPRPQPAAVAAARPARVLRPLRGADRHSGSSPSRSTSGRCSGW